MTLAEFLVIVNKVTSLHKCGKPIPKDALDKLCKAQVTMESQFELQVISEDIFMKIQNLAISAKECHELAQELLNETDR